MRKRYLLQTSAKNTRIRQRGSVLLLPLLLVLLAWLLAGCFGSGEGDGDGTDSATVAKAGDEGNGKAATDTTDQKPKRKEKAIKVNVGEVVKGRLVMPIYADGTIRTPRSLVIRTKIPGELIAVKVRDGDRVRKGHLLARFDPRQYEIALEESRYRHLQALSQMAAEADTFSVNHAAEARFYARRDDLQGQYEKGNVSREEYRARLLELEMASLNEGAFRQDVFQQRTGLAEARMVEERTKLDLEYTEIRAPFAGVVQGLQVVVGEILSVGAPICNIYNNDRLEAVVNVLEADLGNLVAGRAARLAIPATGDTLLAKVDVISPNLDQASRTCEVIIRFDNDEDRFRPGMFVRAEVAGFIYDDKLLVPKAALLTRDNRPLVFKKNDDRAQWLYVDIGLQNDNWIEILAVHSGGSLAPGEEVVVSDHLTLAHEAKIKVRKRLPTVNRWSFAEAAAGVQ